MPLLEGKRVIITGAGKGLGRAYARGMAREGARVLVNDVDAVAAQKVVQEIAREGGRAAANTDSVAGWESARRIIEHCVTAFSGIDVLVNNAGVSFVKPIWQVTEADYDLLMGVNLKGVFNCSRHAMDRMIPQKRGCIINVSSGAQAGLIGRPLYSGSKAGIAGFTYTWAMELAPLGIRVNALSPLARTPMTEAAYAVSGENIDVMPDPDSIAPLAVFLASDDASFITGQIIRHNGKTLSIFAHPRPILPATREGGWTAHDIREYFYQTVAGKLEPVGIGVAEYRYGAGVGQAADASPGAAPPCP